MNKYLSMVLSAVAILTPALSADAANVIATFVEHNVVLSSALVTLGWVIFHLLPSPLQAQITAAAPPKES